MSKWLCKLIGHKKFGVSMPNREGVMVELVQGCMRCGWTKKLPALEEGP